MDKLRITSISTLLVSSILILVPSLTTLEINNWNFRFTLLYIFLFSLIGLFISYPKRRTTIKLKSITLISIISLIFYPLAEQYAYFNNWRTQTIIYQNVIQKNRAVKFQLEDAGAFGYNRRIVDQTEILPFIYRTRLINKSELEQLDNSDWNKVNIHINEAELKGG